MVCVVEWLGRGARGERAKAGKDNLFFALGQRLQKARKQKCDEKGLDVK